MGSSSSSTTSRTVYGDTTTTNPYFTSKTDNSGTKTVFNQGTALDSINNFVNQNMDNLLEEYLNPTLNSVTNQAKMNSYVNALNNQSAKAFENNIINPLSKRNMLRSSQLENLTKGLENSNTNAIGNYANELLQNSQSDTASLLKTLLAAYMSGYTALSDTQEQSLKASQGNSTTTQNSSSSGGSINSNALSNLAMAMALSAI